MAWRSRRVVESTSVMVTAKTMRPLASPPGVTDTVVGPSRVTEADAPETFSTPSTEKAGSPSWLERYPPRLIVRVEPARTPERVTGAIVGGWAGATRTVSGAGAASVPGAVTRRRAVVPGTAADEAVTTSVVSSHS